MADPDSKFRVEGDVITARVTPAVRAMLEKAAGILDVPLDSFLAGAAVEKAAGVLASDPPVKLSRGDTQLLEEMMDNPPEPNDALRAAAALHKKMICEASH